MLDADRSRDLRMAAGTSLTKVGGLTLADRWMREGCLAEQRFTSRFPKYNIKVSLSKLDVEKRAGQNHLHSLL